MDLKRATLLVVLLCMTVVTLGQDFSNLFSNPTNIQNVINEARTIMDGARAMREKMKEAPIDYKTMSANIVFRRFFKRDCRGAREIANSRKMLEVMVERIDRARGWTGRPGEGIPTEVMNELMEASLCNVAPPRCDPNVKYRSINGTCNDLGNPLEGAAFSSFRRLLPARYEDGIQQPVGFSQTFSLSNPRPFDPPRPSARLITQQIIRDMPDNQPDATLMLMQWGHFIDHDFAYLIEASTLAPEEEECEGCDPVGECIPIQVRDDDPDFGLKTPNAGNCLRFERAAAVCRPRIPGIFNPREQLNQITSWLDASMVYGSLDEEQPLLREFRGGRLLESLIPINGRNQRFMPLDPDPRVPCLPPRPCFRGGDLRANEQQGLTAMHTIWVRYHNNLARRLAALNPRWDDERIFQETRKIVYATVEAITYNAYLPRMLGREFFDQNIGPYKGYNPALDGNLVNAFAAAAFRIGHSQVQPFFQRLDANGQTIPEGPLSLELAFFNPDELIRGGGAEPLLRGMLASQSRKLDEFVTRFLTTRLFAQSSEQRIGMDLTAINIQRGRDHGIPSYRVFRNFCRRELGIFGQFANSKTRDLFVKLYGSDDDFDLWPAGIAEKPLPGGILGPTLACIWVFTFLGMREGDRFWYENPGVFTPAQIADIREKATLSGVICNASPDFGKIQRDAFSASDPKVDCSLIPQLDLRLWAEGSTTTTPPTPPGEEKCWFKVQTTGPTTRRSVVRSLYRYSRDAYSWMKGEQKPTEPSGSITQAACVQFICPTTDSPVIVAVQAISDTAVIRETVIGDLPPDKATQIDIYKAEVPQRYGTQFGIYKSLEECERGGSSLNTGAMNPFGGIGVSYRF